MRACTLIIAGGPLDGKELTAAMPTWPPPTRLAACDIGYDVWGTYVLREYTMVEPFRARYSPRIDDDYHRLRVSTKAYYLERLKAGWGIENGG